MSRWLSIIGIGEDGIDGLSAAAKTLVAGAALVVGGRRHLDLIAPLIAGRALPWKSPIEDTLFDILAARGKAVCILASGDPFHYGVGTMLMQHVDADEMLCLPQPSSFSLAAVRLGWTLQDTALVSIHGRPMGRILRELQHHRRILALAWDGATAMRLAQTLIERGFGQSRLHLMQALGGPDEAVETVCAAALEGRETHPLTIIGIDVLADAGARQIHFAGGYPDDWFEHDGQMTRREMRAVVLSALQPLAGQRLWDIGGGAGSIAIEWLLRHLSLAAICFEKDTARCQRIARNAATFGVDNLVVIEGEAPAALVGQPAPDAIFIGGGTSDAALMEACWLALRPGGRLVANAVTIEGAERLAHCQRAYGGELIRLSIERLEPVGAFHAFKPSMPVAQWAVTKGFDA